MNTIRYLVGFLCAPDQAEIESIDSVAVTVLAESEAVAIGRAATLLEEQLCARPEDFGDTKVVRLADGNTGTELDVCDVEFFTRFSWDDVSRLMAHVEDTAVALFHAQSKPTQAALLVLCGSTSFTAEELQAARELVTEPGGDINGHLFEALQKSPWLSGMFPERQLEAIAWARGKAGKNTKWPEFVALFEKWRTSSSRDRTPIEETQDKPAMTATRKSPSDSQLERFNVLVALLVMDVRPSMAKASDVRNAKQLISDCETAWSKWRASLLSVPGIHEIEQDALYEMLLDGMKKLSMIHDDDERENYLSRVFGASGTAQDDSHEIVTADETVPESPEGEHSEQVETETSNEIAVAPGTESEQCDAPQPTQEPERTGPFYWLMRETGEFGRANKMPKLTEMLSRGAVEILSPEYFARKRGEYVEPDAQEAATDVVATSPAERPVAEKTHATDAHVEPEAVPDSEPQRTFEPGRYENIPNEVYHAANGISSTMVKDARVSLMYFEGRHVTGRIVKERSKVLDMGNLVHTMALQPELLHKEYSIEPEIPEGAFTTSDTLRKFITEYNDNLEPALSVERIRELIEEHNATLTPCVSLGESIDETTKAYNALPDAFRRLPDDAKFTAGNMKACIREYNATLEKPLKTNGSRDALLSVLATIYPELAEKENNKPGPLKVTGNKAELAEIIRRVKPDSVFADELVQEWKDNPEGKILVTRDQLATAKAIRAALLQHPKAAEFLTHPQRAIEVSYFSVEEETGLEVRVRPDIEISEHGHRIGVDLKSISLWNVKKDAIRSRIHREIIERDYHLSAAMYCETACLDQFYWIFVNKDENYHWVTVVEASHELLALGMEEYKKSIKEIANGYDTGSWPAPVDEEYMDFLTDYEMAKLERMQKLSEVL